MSAGASAPSTSAATLLSCRQLCHSAAQGVFRSTSASHLEQDEVRHHRHRVALRDVWDLLGLHLCALLTGPAPLWAMAAESSTRTRRKVAAGHWAASSAYTRSICLQGALHGAQKCTATCGRQASVWV